MENCVFSGCIKLREVILPEYLIFVGDKSFKDCRLLEKLTLPETVRGIGDFAFTGCYNLEYLEISQYVKHIGKSSLCHDTFIIVPNNAIHLFKEKMPHFSKRIYDMAGYKQMLINEEENEGRGFIDYSDISIDDERY